MTSPKRDASAADIDALNRWKRKGPGPFILRYSVTLFGKKHVIAQVFESAWVRKEFREHIVRLWNATII